ncbi:MAG: DUF559 domain-containing protein [Hyphomonadaceae bacterium]|nr:DUF559 domain-containing protein [Hyphomonadaceae bacterium]
MKHPPEVDRARRLRQTQSVAEKLLWERLRRNQLNVRDAPEHVLDWIARVGELVLAGKFVGGELRRLDHVPRP